MFQIADRIEKERVMSTTRSLIAHLQRHSTPAKQCFNCKRDVGHEWRTKTAQGHYLCQPCLYALQQAANLNRINRFDDENLLVLVKSGH